MDIQIQIIKRPVDLWRAFFNWELSRQIENEYIPPFSKATVELIDKASIYWQYHNPDAIAGRLRILGFLAVGTLEDERVALIPADLRPLLIRVLKKKI